MHLKLLLNNYILHCILREVFFKHTCTHYRDPSRTKLIYTFQTDLRGKIPPKLIETTLPSIQITFFKNLRKAIKENFKEKTGKTCCL